MSLPFNGSMGAERKVEEIKRLTPEWLDDLHLHFVAAAGSSDEEIVKAIAETRASFVLGEAEGSDLEVVGSNHGIRKPTRAVVSDEAFTAYIKALAFKPKAITERIEEVLAILLGPQDVVGWAVYEVRPNTITIEVGTYRPPAGVSGGTHLFRSSHPTNPALPGDYLVANRTPTIQRVRVNGVVARGYTGVVLTARHAVVPVSFEDVIDLIKAAGVTVEFVKRGN